MSRDTREAVRRMLAAHHTLTLATAGDDGPWAAAVFFACDDALNLYFVSDPGTRHGRDIARDARAAAAIHPDCSGWAEVRGLQIEGRAEVLEGAEREPGLALYLARFPEIARLLAAPGGSAESVIAERFRSATLYRLRPDRIRLIDNSRGFGHKKTLKIP